MLENWGEMTKTQDNPQTINQAIDAAISAHEADPESHMGVGESIENHRVNDIIDHPAYSVIDDKIKVDKYLIQDWFSSLDGYNKSGNYFNYIGFLQLYTTTSLNNATNIYAPADDVFSLAADISKNPIFETVAVLSGHANFTARFGFGEMGDDNGVGFEINKSTAFVVWHDTNPEEHKISIPMIALGELHKFRVVFTSGDVIQWYIDNVLVYQLNISQLDVQNSQGWIYSFGIQNKQAGYVSTLCLYRVLYQQDI